MELDNGYRVSVLQDTKVLEIPFTAWGKKKKKKNIYIYDMNI